jgi:3-deoxy-D-manno-octulosonic-acid transferase
VARLGQAEDGRRLLGERLGFLPKAFEANGQGKRTIWIHSVSVGEVLAVEKLVQSLVGRQPELRVVWTTVTPTGQRLAKKSESDRIQVSYFPFDFRFSVRRFFKTLKPALLLLVETEIWPNVIKEAGRSRVPVGVINGRISERSFKAFRRFSIVFKPLLGKIGFFLVQTEQDRERLIELGVGPEKVTVTGNLKLDALDFSDAGQGEGPALRQAWGFLPSDQILIGGSTHAGEEEILLGALERLREEKLPVKLLLAPRHIERALKVLKLAKKRGFAAVLASGRGAVTDFDVLILDRLGELRKLYAMADAVVMGGSFVRRGGQNPIEPACLRRPVLHGPWVFNFHEIYRQLDEEGGSLRVKSEEELVFALKRILASDRERQHLGERAYETLNKLRGATERTLHWIERSTT